MCISFIKIEKIAFKIVIMSYRVFFRTISKQYMFVLESMQGAIMSAASLQQCLPQACGKYSQQAHFFSKGARINIQWSFGLSMEIFTLSI